MVTSSPYTVLVGVDGSQPSQEALRWALWHARLATGRVLAIQTWEIHPLYRLENIAEEFHDAAVTSLQDTIRKLDADTAIIEQRALEGHPAEVLLAQSREAQLLVIGNRGHGGFAGALLGSVSQHCVHHARCPVVIVRGTSHT